MRHLIDIKDLTVDEINSLINTAEDIAGNPAKYAHKCDGKKLATLFFEASTRTRLSFEAAMYELGGNVLGFSSADSSSTVKGESVTDTVTVVSNYADIIAMRHPYAGAPVAAVSGTGVPIINAGDGGHYHPTQTLADLLTIHREKGKLTGLKIGVCGDLRFGRTVHSLISAMMRYEGTKFVLISPDELRLPDYMINELEKNNISYEEEKDLAKAVKDLDILYMTRIQKERFDDKAEYERLKDSYILDLDKMKYANENMSILHPLPRVNEISVKIDTDKRACYFRQTLNGKFMRMALILMLFDNVNTPEKFAYEGESIENKFCKNPKCITAVTHEIRQAFKVSEDKKCRCVYCESLCD